MALEFKCQNCDADIVVKFIKVGETAACRSCGDQNVVPETAAEATDKAYYLYHLRRPKSDISQTENTSTEEMEQEDVGEIQEVQQREDEIPVKKGFPIVVVALLGINALLWLLMEAAGGSTQIPVLYRFGAQLNSAVFAGEFWRLFTSMFLHIGILHLLFNCLALFFYGWPVERMYGRYRFLAIYLISGYFGNILFLAIGSPIIVSAGASGAVFGILGAHLPLNRRLKKGSLFVDRRRAGVGIGYVIWIFVYSMGEGVNVLAHLGGVIAGVALGFALCPSSLSAEELQEGAAEGGKRPKWVMQIAVIGATVIVLTIVGFLAGNRANTYGELLEFNGGQLFYTSSVTRAEAVELGDFLIGAGFFDGNPKTAQLDKSEDTYHFRMIVKEDVEQKPEYIIAFQLLASGISSLVFDSSPVEIHLCNNSMETIKIVKSTKLLESTAQPPPQRHAEGN